MARGTGEGKKQQRRQRKEDAQKDGIVYGERGRKERKGKERKRGEKRLYIPLD
jgi:hypothetical protein